MSPHDDSAPSFCCIFNAQGYDSPMVKLVPEGRARNVIASTSFCFWFCLFIVIVAMILGVLAFGIEGLLLGIIPPLLFLTMRYLWWRLVLEPFGSWPSDEVVKESPLPYMTFLAATAQVCCPSKCNYRRVCCQKYTPPYLLATAIFWSIYVLSVVGLMISNPVGHQAVNPPQFVVICWNTGGAIVLLVVAVWMIDGFVLMLTWICSARYAFTERRVAHQPLKRNDGEVINNNQLNNDEKEMINNAPLDMILCVPESREEALLGGESEAAKEFDEPSTDISSHTVSSGARIKTRLYKRRLMALCSVLIFIIMLSFSTADSYNDPRSVKLSIPLRQLPSCADGFKIALLTDIHAGSLVGDNDIRNIVSLVKRWRPDVVVISGDLGDQRVNSALRSKVLPLSELSNTPDGVFWTPGNHENMAGIQAYRDLFSPAALSVNNTSPLKFILTLENSYESVIFSRSNSSNCTLDFAGLADASGEDSTDDEQLAPDINQTLHGRDPKNALVLLNHQPVHFQRYAKAGAGLILSGHTHGGQLWPNHSLLWFVFGTFISGLFTDSSPNANIDLDSEDVAPAYMYVSEGTVGWGPRVRFLSYPEISYITLRNPNIFFSEGGSTTRDEAWRTAVIAQVVGLTLIPISILICALQAFGCCWRQQTDHKANKGCEKLFGLYEKGNNV